MIKKVIKPIFGDVKCTANQLTFTVVAPDERDDSDFTTIIRATKPSVNVSPMEEIKPLDIFTKIGGLGRNTIAYCDVTGYSSAIMPDWVEIGNIIEEFENDPYPSISDVNIEFENAISGHCSNMSINTPIETKVIGKNGKLILRSDEVSVEICDHTNTVLEDIQVHELNPLETMVTYDLDVSLGAGVGNISGSSTVIKTISVVSNKNNFIDLYVDMDGILGMDNLPNGLKYKNKHITDTY